MNPLDHSSAQPQRPCPVCDGLPVRFVFRQRFAAMSGGWPMEGYDVVVCATCGCGYADGIPEQSVLDRYYREMSKYEHQDRGGQESALDLARFQAIAAIVAHHAAPPGPRVFEIGCASGGLLAVLKGMGYRDLLGADPSPVCTEAVHRLYGIEAVTGAIADLASLDRRFDLVLLCNVLEHVREAKAALALVRQLLAPGGRLFLEVPDAARFAEWEDAPFQQFSTEHVNYFSPASLTNQMRAAGFLPVELQQNVFAIQDGQRNPVIDAVFQKHASDARVELVLDAQTEPALRAYVERSRAADERLRRVLGEAMRAGPLIVWGAGAHTLRLLATGGLAEARIVAFVDSNPRYQGKQLAGAPILAPAELAGRREPILISSRGYQGEILDQIRRVLRLANEVFLLYDQAEPADP